MSGHQFKQVDFENPSVLFILEDKLKGLLGCPLLYNRYFRTFGLKGDERVLDFGCGGGAGSRCLAKLLNNNGHLTCVDISSYWMSKASKRLNKYPNVKCLTGDIRKLEIPELSFSVISIFHVIHDIAPEDRQAIVTTLGRKLEGNGAIFVRERIGESHGMPVGEIRALFTDAGLSEVYFRQSKSEYIGKFKSASSSI